LQASPDYIVRLYIKKKNVIRNRFLTRCVVKHACNPSMQKPEAGGPQFGGHPGLHSSSVSVLPTRPKKGIDFYFYNNRDQARHQRLRPKILATKEAEIRRIKVRS
jgi:hypothetical protein